MRPYRPLPAQTLAALSSLLVVLAGCSTSHVYGEPQLSVSHTWHSPLPHSGNGSSLANWWRQFDDLVLDNLIARAERGSPTLAQASAGIQRARATLAGTEAGGLPQVTGTGSATHARQQSSVGGAAIATTRSSGLDAAWELDLFGRVRQESKAAQARVDARKNDWHDARVSLAAEVADTYVRYRSCGLLVKANERELDSVSRTEAATAVAVQAGFSAPADATLARAAVASTRSTLAAQRGQCELLVKALVDLTDTDEPELRPLLAQGLSAVPQPLGLVVVSVPAQLIRQRPDVASLERELAAASAEIGAAKADLYPSLSLSGSVAVAAVGGVSSVRTWSFGPALSIPVFDGRQRRAAVRSAEADFASRLAQWRQGVRTAVREVEEAMVNLDTNGRRADDSRRATEEYRRYLSSIEANWRAGNESLLTLEEARRSALLAEHTLYALQQQRVQSWIALYKALGGGWQRDATITPPQPLNDKSESGGAP